MNCIIRPCTVKDCKVIMQLIKDVAVDCKMLPSDVKVTVEALREDGFGARPQYDCYLVELPPSPTKAEGGRVVGYVLSVFTYSAWKGRTAYVDNLYVQPQFRGWRIGKQLIGKAAEVAMSQGCGQLRMHVASWKAYEQGFLALWGGEDLTAKAGYTLFRFKEDALRRLVAHSKFEGPRGWGDRAQRASGVGVPQREGASWGGLSVGWEEGIPREAEEI